jgi:hypothetical protein
MYNEAAEQRDRFRDKAQSVFDNTAGDDLTRIVDELKQTNQVLLGLFRFRKVDEEALFELQVAEQAIHELLYPRWRECQKALDDATDDQLEDSDTEWHGKDMPVFFGGMTLDRLKDEVKAARSIRVPTNPATLKAVGAA